MDDAEKVRAVRSLISCASQLQQRGLRDIHPTADEREICFSAQPLVARAQGTS